MNGPVAVGIDLGTTNSAMACLDESGRSTMIRNAEGEMLTPSIVLFSPLEVVVGKNARSAVVTHPDLVAQWVKRDMGAPFYSHPIHGERLPPEVIQACILRKMRLDAAAAVGPDAGTVITVPAYFDEPRRKATADAGEMAGLRVIDIVNEPTAAALAFGEALGYLSAGGLPKEQITVMVYDLGGGTFDVTLLKLAAGKVQTLATDGDVQLGGHDWDRRLVDHVGEIFRKQHHLDPRDDAAALNRLFQTVMEAKHTLSARSRTSIRVEHAGRTVDVPLVREQFEEMTADLLERTAYTSRQLLSAAGLQWKDVNRILLVGGSTRMPMVPRILQKVTGIEPDRTVNPDEAVARGAALYAGHLLAVRSSGPAASFAVTNVNAHSLGIEGIEAETLRKTNVILIPRNTALPAKRMERFVTKAEGQQSIVVKVLEGESTQPAECTTIGRTVVRDLPAGLPKAWPVEITFEYATNGRLSVRAVVPGTHHQAELSLEREVGLSGAGIARWKVPVSAAAGFDVFEVAVHESLAATPPAAAAGSSGILAPGPRPGASMALPSLAQQGTPTALPPTYSVPVALQGTPTALPPTFSAPVAQQGTPTALPPTFPASLVQQATPGALPTFSAPLPLGTSLSPSGMTAMPSAAPSPEAAMPMAGAAAPALPSVTSAAPTPWGPQIGPRPGSAGGKRAPSLFTSPAARIVGHFLAATIGLGCGYLLLRWLRPDLLPW
jgi:molecular chaperone DnaK